MRNDLSILRQALAIIFLSIVLGIVYNAFSAKSVSLIRTEAKKIVVADSLLFADPQRLGSELQPLAESDDTVGPKNTKVVAPLHERALTRKDSIEKVIGKKEETTFNVITLEQLKRLLDQKRGVLLDARNDDEYRKGHITGARSIPALEIDKHFEKIVMIPRDTLLLVYCNNAECPLGRQLAEFLIAMEFKKIFLYDDGWDGWEKARMPIDTTMIPE